MLPDPGRRSEAPPADPCRRGPCAAVAPALRPALWDVLGTAAPHRRCGSYDDARCSLQGVGVEAGATIPWRGSAVPACWAAPLAGRAAALAPPECSCSSWDVDQGLVKQQLTAFGTSAALQLAACDRHPGPDPSAGPDRRCTAGRSTLRPSPALLRLQAWAWRRPASRRFSSW